MSANLRNSFQPRLLVLGLLAAVVCLHAQLVVLGDDRDGSAPRRYVEKSPVRQHAIDRGPAAPAVSDEPEVDSAAESRPLQLIAVDAATTSGSASSPGSTVSNNAAQIIVVPGESAAATDSTGRPAPQVTLNPQDEMQRLAARAIEISSRRQLKAGFHTPWQIVHGILAYRWDFRLKKADDSGTVSAIEYLMGGAMHKGLPLWHETPYGGRGQPFTEPYAFEGHPTQFMGYMSMANIPLDYEVVTPTRTVRIRDLVNDAKMQVRVGPEITWTLWALAHYEEPDSQWVNAYGEPWSIERLVQMQIDEPVYRAACGGTHGLFALAYARNMYLSTGKQLTGVWIHADQKIKMYIAQQQALQNADGSFSSNYFVGPGHSTDFATRVRTSGHQMEWLMVALPQSRLKEEWIQRGLRAVARDLIDNAKTEADCGPLFHAVHSLVLYRQRTVPGELIPKRNSHLKLADRTSPYVPESRKPRTINVAQPKPVSEPKTGEPKAGDAKTGETKTVDQNSGDQKPGDASKPTEVGKTESKPAEMPAATDSSTAGKPKPESNSPAPIASGEKKVGESKPNDGRSGDGKPSENNPADVPGIAAPGKPPVGSSRTAAVPPERLPSGLNLGPRKPRSQMPAQVGVPKPGDVKPNETKANEPKSSDPKPAAAAKPVKPGDLPKGTSDSNAGKPGSAGSVAPVEETEIQIKPVPSDGVSKDDSPVKLDPPVEAKPATTDSVSNNPSPPGSAPVQPSPAPLSPAPAGAETPQPSPVPPPAN